MDKEFEEMFEVTCETSIVQTIIGMTVMFAVSAFLIYYGIKISFGILTLLGIALIFLGYYVIKKNKGALKRSSFWIKMINENPDIISSHL